MRIDLITGMSLGFAMFSVLDPHGHMQPHFGPMNLRLRCMLPIIVPDGCTITVGEQKRELHPGKVRIRIFYFMVAMFLIRLYYSACFLTIVFNTSHTMRVTNRVLY